MTEINRTALFGKLNALAYQAIESATVFCKMRGNPYVELNHWLNQINVTTAACPTSGWPSSSRTTMAHRVAEMALP